MMIYAIVAVHNRWDFTKKFLASLARQALPPEMSIHTVVVDDGSSDATSRGLAGQPHTTVITGDGSWWWAGSVNRGLGWVKSQFEDSDYVYLGNNDTILSPDHLQTLICSAKENACDLVGSVSFEIWPTGEQHPVTNAFSIDSKRLEVVNIPPADIGRTRIDALAGRGLLLSARAAREIHFQPRLMPQHFADLAATANVIRSGLRPCVALAAESVQLERAGSSVEFKPGLSQVMNKRSPLFLPALVSFWLGRSPRRLPLLWRMPWRGLREMTRGSYRVR
jgi:GT2 family glycosyltransferase